MNTQLLTFNGAHADQRFARDDAGEDLVLREKDLFPPMRHRTAGDEYATPEPQTGEEDDEYGRDDRGDQPPKTIRYGY